MVRRITEVNVNQPRGDSLGIAPVVQQLLTKMSKGHKILKNISVSKRGAEVSKNFLRETETGMKALIGGDMKKFSIEWDNTYLPTNHKEYTRLSSFFSNDLLLLRRVDSCLEATISMNGSCAFNKNVYGINIFKSSGYSPIFVLGWLNSKAVDFYYKKKFSTKKDGAFPEIQTYLYEQLPIPIGKTILVNRVIKLVEEALKLKFEDSKTCIDETVSEIDHIVCHLYDLTYDDVLIIDPDTPITREQYESFN